jgi:hypothetical protein
VLREREMGGNEWSLKKVVNVFFEFRDQFRDWGYVVWRSWLREVLADTSLDL